MQKTAETVSRVPGPQYGSNLNFGNELLGTGLVGIGLGGGVLSLYHLLNKMKRDKQKARIAPSGLTALSSGGPVMARLDAPEDVPEEEQKAASVATNALIGGLIGAGGGGLYGAMTATPEDKNESSLTARLRGALRGAAGGAAIGGGIGGAYEPLAAGIGGAIPKQLFPKGIHINKKEYMSPNAAHEAWRTVLNLGFLGGGALGGRAIVNHFADKEKERENEDDVERARREYFDALSGKDEKAAAALDGCFQQFEKTGVWEWFQKAPALVYTGMLLSALGGAGIGGTYMYNRTKKLSDAENLRRAIESRARMRGTPATWVDPDELAAAKQMAVGEEQPRRPRLGHNPSEHG